MTLLIDVKEKERKKTQHIYRKRLKKTLLKVRETFVRGTLAAQREPASCITKEPWELATTGEHLLSYTIFFFSCGRGWGGKAGREGQEEEGLAGRKEGGKKNGKERKKAK